jgi:hypothetical protein
MKPVADLPQNKARVRILLRWTKCTRLGGGSSNGRTADSGSASSSSNLLPPAIKIPSKDGIFVLSAFAVLASEGLNLPMSDDANTMPPCVMCASDIVILVV